MSVVEVRLFELLDRAAVAPATWVQGWPGAGKTILASTYLAARGGPHVWYTVDPGDRDPASLFRYFTDAASIATGEDQGALPVYEAVPGADIEAFGRLFFRELLVRLAAGTVVVLDNVHEAEASADFCSLLRVLIEEIPQAVRVLCVSRSVVPNLLARSAINGRLAQIAATDLQLSDDEARALVAADDAHGTHSTDAIATLNRPRIQ